MRAPWGRSGDDLYMLYTGGTTGMPKGVMWRQDDLFARLIDSGVRHYQSTAGIEAVRAALAASPGGVTLLPACPLMHGTGNFPSNTVLAEGGRVCLLESRAYDPVELLDTIERERVNALVIVGDPFARPLLAALDEHPGRWDLSSLMMIISSGAMWSEPVKEGLLAHHRAMLLVDAFSSSEALGMGVSVSAGGTAAKTASFTLGPRRQGADRGRPAGGRRAPTRSASWRWAGATRSATTRTRRSRAARSRRSTACATPSRATTPRSTPTAPSTCSAGARSASTRAARRSSPRRSRRRSRPTTRCATPSSWASRTRPTASRSWPWSSCTEGSAEPAEAELIEHVKERLASYKAPRRVRTVATIGRAPNGKVDYKRHRAESMEELGAAAG